MEESPTGRGAPEVGGEDAGVHDHSPSPETTGSTSSDLQPDWSIEQWWGGHCY